MDIYIRNIDPGIKIKLKENAKKKGISLNEYVKNILETAALSIEITSLDDKYSNLTKELLSIYTGIIEKNTSVIAENNYILSKLIKEK
jgi:plasmid stability protein